MREEWEGCNAAAAAAAAAAAKQPRASSKSINRLGAMPNTGKGGG